MGNLSDPVWFERLIDLILAAVENREANETFMTTINWFLTFGACLFLGCSACAQGDSGARSAETLNIDIPTRLDKANVVIDFGHSVYAGDMPFALGDINLLATNLHDWNAKGQIIVIFHGDAAYLILNDQSYDADRHVASGNPYKAVLSELMAKGVELELCGATAGSHHWGNANLLPGVKVNLNAMVRVTELEQNGFTMIYQ